MVKICALHAVVETPRVVVGEEPVRFGEVVFKAGISRTYSRVCYILHSRARGPQRLGRVPGIDADQSSRPPFASRTTLRRPSFHQARAIRPSGGDEARTATPPLLHRQ